jgi:hypothetical protein
MNFLQYLNESLWTKKKAINFIANFEPTFLKANIQVDIAGSVQSKGESENDLDLMVIKKTPKSFDKLKKELETNKDKLNIERIDIEDGNISLILKPDRKVVDIIFNNKEKSK